LILPTTRTSKEAHKRKRKEEHHKFRGRSRLVPPLTGFGLLLDNRDLLGKEKKIRMRKIRKKMMKKKNFEGNSWILLTAWTSEKTSHKSGGRSRLVLPPAGSGLLSDKAL